MADTKATSTTTASVTLPAKLALILAQLQRIAHDTEVKGRGAYTATSINAIADVLRPLLAEQGIVLVPFGVEMIRHDEVTSASGAKGYHVVIRQDWLITDGEDELRASSFGASIDYSDKAYNQAHT